MSSDAIDQVEALRSDVSSKDELCSLLADVPLFNNLPEATLRLLIPYLQQYRVPADTTIVEPGRLDNHLGIVLEGRAIGYAVDASGERKQSKAITPGMCFGEASLIDDQPQTGTVVAETEAKLVLLSREDFHKLAVTHPVIGVRLLHKLCRLFSQQLRQARAPLVEHLG